MNDETLKEAIRTPVARDILDAMSPETVTALLEKSIVEVIKSFRVTNAIADAAAERANAIAKELMERDEWKKRVEETIQGRFEQYLERLRTATDAMLKKAFHGRNEYPESAAVILRHWPEGG